MKSILDLHTHTIVSGHAFSTIKENIEFAVKRQIKYLGISDHSSNMPASPHKYYFQNLKVIPREVDGVKILRGIEGNILDFEGNLDIDEDLYPGLDYVIASLHPPCVEFGSIEQNSFREGAKENLSKMLKLCKEHNVRVIMGTDSHICYDIGKFDNCEKLIEEVGFPKELVINYHEDQIIDFFDLDFMKK